MFIHCRGSHNPTLLSIQSQDSCIIFSLECGISNHQMLVIGAFDWWLTFGIGLLLHTYYWCEPTEQWPTVPWVILLNKPYIAEQAIYCWAAHACTQCRRAPYRETVLGSGKRIAVLKWCRVWVNKLCSFNLLIEIGRKLHWNTCAAF